MRIFKPSMVPLGATRVLVFQTTYRAWEKEMGAGQIQTSQFSPFLPRISKLFPPSNAPRIIINFWLLSRVLKKLILTIFSGVLTAFKEYQIFGILYPTIPDVLL